MIGVVLLYSEPLGDFWQSGEGVVLIMALFTKLKKVGLRAVAIGENDILLKAGKDCGAQIFKDTGLAEENTDWQLRVEHATKELRKRGFDGEDLLFIDYRFVFLCETSLRRAIEMHTESPRLPLVSLSKTQDHFPQCKTPWAVVSAGPLHIEGSRVPAYGHTAVCRPFRYRWQFGIGEGPHAWVPGPFGFEFHPVSFGRTCFNAEYTWEKCGRLAKIYYTPQTKDDCGLAWAGTCFETMPRLKRNDEKKGFLLSFPDSWKGWPYSLWLYPFNEKTLCCGQTEFYRIESRTSEVELIDKGQAGWWYLLARESKNADFMTPYCPEEGTWRLNADLKPYDIQSAIPLGRRQDMPPFYVADGGLLLVPANHRVNPEGGLDLGDAVFLSLDKPENHAIREEIDVIRMKVIQELDGDRQ